MRDFVAYLLLAVGTLVLLGWAGCTYVGLTGPQPGSPGDYPPFGSEFHGDLLTFGLGGLAIGLGLVVAGARMLSERTEDEAGRSEPAFPMHEPAASLASKGGADSAGIDAHRPRPSSREQVRSVGRPIPGAMFAFGTPGADGGQAADEALRQAQGLVAREASQGRILVEAVWQNDQYSNLGLAFGDPGVAYARRWPSGDDVKDLLVTSESPS